MSTISAQKQLHELVDRIRKEKKYRQTLRRSVQKSFTYQEKFEYEPKKFGDQWEEA